MICPIEGRSLDDQQLACIIKETRNHIVVAGAGTGKTITVITMKNEIVKSYGEMDIANYLYKNGINYQYENPYKINTATEEYARYAPDFYLPDEDIYIEYFGINRNGKVPDYFTAENNKTPSETYKASMTWKRMLHAGNNTVMLELYSYDMMEGQLLQELEEKLKVENVAFNPKSDSALWDEIKKKLRSSNESAMMSAYASNHANEFSLGMIEGYTAKNTVTFMEGTIADLPPNSSVFFIGRYNNDIRVFENSPFKCHYENATGKTMVQYTKRSDLKIEFLSAHRSKGLQADYVFIINNKGKSYGFPSKIQNVEVVQLLLEASDDYQYSEERRLFYVAITRTRKKAWLLVEKYNKSVFVQEFFSGFAKEIMNERYTCPKCGGRIFKKKSVHGEFFGCSNYRLGCTYTKNIAVKKQA